MHRFLIIKSFEKAKEDEEKKSGISPTNTQAALLLSDFIYDDQKFKYGEKSLYNHFKDSTKNETKNVVIKQPQVVQGLCTFLGYESFDEFRSANENPIHSNRDKVRSVSTKKKNYLIAIGLFLIVLISVLVYSANRERWMVWENDRYVEVNFDPKTYDLGQLKLYNEDRIANFKKIEVDCATQFFDKRGKVLVWYGKNNNNKELEFFTSLGLHPETGKTLKPITRYMITKYVCPDY